MGQVGPVARGLDGEPVSWMNPPGKVTACRKPIAKSSFFMLSTYSGRSMVLSPTLMPTSSHIIFNNSLRWYPAPGQ
jgi:hypothetical protein